MVSKGNTPTLAIWKKSSSLTSMSVFSPVYIKDLCNILDYNSMQKLLAVVTGVKHNDNLSTG